MKSAAAACWIVAGCGYLILEATAAAGFEPRYGYASNMISDLGRPGLSALAPLMNAAFILQGSLFLVAAVLVAWTTEARAAEVRAVEAARDSTAFLTFAAMNAVGNIVVATIHSESKLHVAGAVIAIVGGNAAILAGSSVLRTAGAANWYRIMSRGLAAGGLIAFAILAIQSITDTVFVAPDATLERVSVYTIILWQVVSAVHLQHLPD